jgi:hypothetical protein
MRVVHLFSMTLSLSLLCSSLCAAEKQKAGFGLGNIFKGKPKSAVASQELTAGTSSEVGTMPNQQPPFEAAASAESGSAAAGKPRPHRELPKGFPWFGGKGKPKSKTPSEGLITGASLTLTDAPGGQTSTYEPMTPADSSDKTTHRGLRGEFPFGEGIRTGSSTVLEAPPTQASLTLSPVTPPAPPVISGSSTSGTGTNVGNTTVTSQGSSTPPYVPPVQSQTSVSSLPSVAATAPVYVPQQVPITASSTTATATPPTAVPVTKSPSVSSTVPSVSLTPAMADMQDTMVSPPVNDQETDVSYEEQQSPSFNFDYDRPVHTEHSDITTTGHLPGEEEFTIDTIGQDDPQGNWLFKRVWWQFAEASYEKLRKLVDQVHDVRVHLLLKKEDTEHTILDPFYLNIGIGQGELQALIADLLSNRDYLQGGAVHDQSDEQRELNENIERDRAELEQLQRDVSAIVNLEGSLDHASDTLIQQVEQVRSLEQEAWEYFKEISWVLNDQKAKELFYKIKNCADNIRVSLDYLENAFSGSFDDLIQKIVRQVDRVKMSLQALKEKGVELKGKAQQMAQAERAKLKPSSVKTDEELEAEEEEEESSSWLSWLVRPFTWLGSKIIAIIRAPYDLVKGFFVKPVDEEEEEVSEHEPA